MKHSYLFFGYLFTLLCVSCKTTSAPVLITYPSNLFYRSLKADSILLVRQDTIPKKTNPNITFEDDVLKSVQKIVALKAQINQKKKHPVYNILTYSGNSRKEAEKLYDILSTHVNKNVTISYEQPNYKVKVGYYFTQLEAYSAMQFLKQYYRNPIQIKEYVFLTEKDITISR